MDAGQVMEAAGATKTPVAGAVADFEKLFTSTFRRLVRFAERRLPKEASAEDIASETLAIAWQSISKGRSVNMAWLYTVACNKIADFYRSRERHRAITEAVADRARAQSVCAEVDIRDAVTEALSALEYRDREALTLTYWDGLSAAEVAKVLNLSVPATWAVLSRARKRLRVALAGSHVREACTNELE